MEIVFKPLKYIIPIKPEKNIINSHYFAIKTEVSHDFIIFTV